MTVDSALRMAGRGKIYSSITETVGDTPLVALDRIAKENKLRIAQIFFAGEKLLVNREPAGF